MSRFFVGQRVRIVGVFYPDNAYLIGREDVVRAVEGNGFVLLTLVGALSGTDRIQERFLEPILPEGHRAGDYSFRELMDRCREGVTA